MMTYREIAKRLGISHGGVIVIEKRALAKMAAQARKERMLCAEMFESAANRGPFTIEFASPNESEEG